MSALGTIRNGQVTLDISSPWPDGSRVTVENLEEGHSVPGFMTEEEQGTDPVSIARWIAMVNAQPEYQLSDEEAEFMEREIKEFGKHSLITDQDLSEFMP